MDMSVQAVALISPGWHVIGKSTTRLNRHSSEEFGNLRALLKLRESGGVGLVCTTARRGYFRPRTDRRPYYELMERNKSPERVACSPCGQRVTLKPTAAHLFPGFLNQLNVAHIEGLRFQHVFPSRP